MREWVIKDYTGYKGLVLQECELQQPGPSEVRLRIEAFALNWGDADLMLDHYSFSFERFPARIGMEACGIVDALGEGVTGIELGDRYCTLPYFYFNKGASADFVVIETKYITKAPEGLSAVECASIWMQYLTAYFPLTDYIQAGPESTILIPAATSTAGNAALQIGKMMGANMIGTTRYAYNKVFLLESGASHVFVDDGTTDIAKAIYEFSEGKGFDLAFDCIGKGMMNRYSKAVARDGIIVLYGWLSGEEPSVPILDMIVKNASFRPYSLFNYVDNVEKCEEGRKFVYKGIEDGLLIPKVDKVYPMESYREAWDYLRNPRKNHGKVVIQVN